MTPTVRGFVVATRYETVEELVAGYHARADESSIFVGIVEERVLGTECAFAILLANKQPVLAGICIVRELYRDADNPYGRRGMRLEIRRLGISGERVFAAMAEARAAAGKRRFPRGSTAPPEDVISVERDDETSEGIPRALEDELTSPAQARA